MKKLTKNLYYLKDINGKFIVFNRQNLGVYQVSEKFIKSKRRNKLKYNPIKLKKGFYIQKTKPTILGFRISLTETCNLRCKYCFVTKGLKKPKTMDKKTIDKIINYGLKLGKQRSIKYHFFGGEPLIKFDYIKYFVEKLQKNVENGTVKQPIYTITTNGTLIDEEKAKFLSRYNVSVGVSIDGLKKDNDKFRVYATGKGTFEDITKGFKTLEKFNIKRWFLITPYDNNIGRIEQLVKYLMKNFSFTTITINTPFDENNIIRTVNGKQFAKLVLKVISICKKHNISVESASSSLLYSLYSGIKRKSACSLYQDQIIVSVSPDGRFSSCAQYRQEDLVKNKEIKKLYAYKLKISKCKNCIAENICGGTCPIAHMKTGLLLDKNKCSFYKEFLNLFLYNIEEYVDLQ